MTVVSWVTTDMASWIFFSMGVLSAVLAIVENLLPASMVNRPIRSFFRYLSAWSPAVAGPLLLLGGVVLAATGQGQLSWLNIVSGAICLFVFAYLFLLEQFKDVRRYVELAERRSGDLDFLKSELPGRVASNVRDGVLGLYINEYFPSKLADAIYCKLTEPDTWTVESFEAFANSMVRTGAWAPVSVYTDDDGSGLKDAVAAVLREFGLTTAVEKPPVQGAWFQRLWARSREVAESEPVRERLEKLAEAVHLERVGKHRAEIDKAKSESVAALIDAMKEQENAVIRIGSIVMIKTQGDLVFWTIGEMEAAALEKNNDLLGDPVAALKFLRGGNQMPDNDELSV